LTNIDDLPRHVFKYELLKPNGWFILEHTPRNNYKSFEGYRTERNYGTTIFSIFINKVE
jgi:16S rRNA (guanine966-N2)-methyltransferase